MTALRIGLGLVLVAAGLAKLARPGAAADGVADVLGRTRGARGLALGLAALEVALGGWLLTGIATRAAGAAVAAVALVFVVALVAARRRGRTRLACACFGGRAERPTWLLAMRAAALGAAAGLVAVAPAEPGATALLSAAVAVLALAVVALAVLVLALYRQVGVLALRSAPRTALELAEEGPELGDPAPELAGLARTGRVLVAFLGEGCRICRALEPSLRAIASRDLEVRVVRDVEDGGAVERWNVPGTPFVVHVVDGTAAAKGLVNSLEELEGLIALGDARARRHREAVGA